MHGYHNSDIPMASQKIEPLEHNTELGVYLRQPNQESDGARDIYFAQFNPTFRFMATAGSGYMAHLWNLRDEQSDLKLTEIPHIKNN